MYDKIVFLSLLVYLSMNNKLTTMLLLVVRNISIIIFTKYKNVYKLHLNTKKKNINCNNIDSNLCF